jgi:1D-myo-inositol 3-kinase
MNDRSSALVVGHYSHDTLINANGTHSAALGGSASYISSVFSALRVDCRVVSKVGSDFAYHAQTFHRPRVIAAGSTTHFIADFTHGERVGSVGKVCEAIFPSDIPEDGMYELGLAVGIVGEVLPETLFRLSQRSRYLLCDLQGMIRTIDAQGHVGFRRLEDTPFYPLLEKITFLKASRFESQFMDLEKVRFQTCVLVTDGKEGCTVYQGQREFRVPAYTVKEVDPTGAGDCFLAGFAAGLLRKLPIEEAVRLGNYFGALAVENIGVPKLDSQLVQNFSLQNKIN